MASILTDSAVLDFATSDNVYIETFQSIADLQTIHFKKWTDLANATNNPNPFYEHWSLIPALKYFEQEPVDLVFIWQDDDRKMLLGFIPLESRDRYFKLPFKNSVSWCHIHAYLATPLVRQHYESLVYEKILAYVDQYRPKKLFLSFRDHCDSKYIETLLNQKALKQNRFFSYFEKSTRAMLDSRVSYDELLKSSLSRKRRKEYRRLRNRLSELGKLESVCYSETSDRADLDFFIDGLFAVENSGWKQRIGTSLLANSNQEKYVREEFKAAAEERKLHVQLLLLDGKPIAGVSCFITRPTAYLFKIGHISEYEQYSPGSLVILDISRQLCELEGVDWVDSCAKEGHTMIEKIWRDKQTIVQYRLSTRHFFSAPLLRVLTWLRKLFSNQLFHLVKQADTKKTGVEVEGKNSFLKGKVG